MKKVLVFTLISATILSFFSFSSKNGEPGKVKWYSIEEAVELSKKTKKKIVIDVYTDWCGWCKRMDKATFNNPEVAKYINENFYAVKLNGEQKEEIIFKNHKFKFVSNGRRGYHEFAAALMDGKMSYPTVVFLNEDLEYMTRVPGFNDAPTFKNILIYLNEGYIKKMSWEQFQKQQQKKNEG